MRLLLSQPSFPQALQVNLARIFITFLTCQSSIPSMWSSMAVTIQPDLANNSLLCSDNSSNTLIAPLTMMITPSPPALATRSPTTTCWQKAPT